MLILEWLDRRHLLDFSPMEGQEEEYITVCDYYWNNPSSLAFCFSDKNGPVLMIGLEEKWEKVYDTFTIFSRNWKPVYYKDAIREARNFFKDFRCDRIEHLVRTDRPWTDKMAKMFGFEYNCTLHKYINGQDYKLYEVVK